MGRMIDSLRDEESFRTLKRLESGITLQLVALVHGSHTSVLSVLTLRFREEERETWEGRRRYSVCRRLPLFRRGTTNKQR